jgi:hypothetical protein
MLNKKIILTAPALMLALSSSAFAWGSIALLKSSTHTKIAAKALSQMDPGRYADMDTASELIKNGSTSEDGHEGIHNGGGKLRDWWTGGDGRSTLKGGVLDNYTKLNIADAYMNIGRMCHLTQDQAVPAHAARVPHSIVLNLPGDGMEKYAGSNNDFGPVPQVDNAKLPYEYYQELQDETRSHLGEWKNPRTQVPYWIQSEEGARLPDPTLGPIGTYGGGADAYREDVLAGSKLTVAGLTPAELCARQLGMAAGYTRALVESASRNLPPLVSGLYVSPNVTMPGRKVEIAFTALENRTAHVKYAVLVAPRGGTAQTVLAGDINLGKPRPAFNTNNGDNAQPVHTPDENLFNRGVTLNWDGLLAGKPLAEGVYTVEVQLTDDDGNTVPASVNTDNVGGNNTVTVLSIVTTEPANNNPFNFN